MGKPQGTKNGAPSNCSPKEGDHRHSSLLTWLAASGQVFWKASEMSAANPGAVIVNIATAPKRFAHQIGHCLVSP
jgi:hypothetical protein